MLSLRIDIYHHGLSGAAISAADLVDAERRIISALTNIGAKTVQELDDLAAEVSQATEVAGSAVALIQGIKAQLDAAGTDKVKLAELSSSLDASTNALAAAVAANTPAAPAPAEPDPSLPAG